MNTIELTSIVKRISNRAHLLGVLACDQLPTKPIRYPCMGIVNTDPSDLPGKHWLAFYITKDKQGYFFDSFGNSPDKFSPEIKLFLLKNTARILYSGRQVQKDFSVTCGQHCVFFLYHVQKGASYSRLINMYSDNLVCNDAMVCHFVNKIRPVSACFENNFDCVQCGY